MSKARVSREEIVATAIRLADEGDLSAVTLRSIAAKLDVHVTSLYNHVPTKAAVLEEMVKALIAEARLPTGTLSWQQWVRRFATAMRRLARKHPGAFEAFHYGPAQGQRAAESFESAFAAFRSAGFEAESTYNAVKATVVAVLGFVLDESAVTRSSRHRTDVSELPVERFPRIHEMGRVAAKAEPFDYLLDALIAGFEANRAKAGGAPVKDAAGSSKPRS